MKIFDSSPLDWPKIYSQLFSYNLRVILMSFPPPRSISTDNISRCINKGVNVLTLDHDSSDS